MLWLYDVNTSSHPVSERRRLYAQKVSCHMGEQYYILSFYERKTATIGSALHKQVLPPRRQMFHWRIRYWPPVTAPRLERSLVKSSSGSRSAPLKSHTPTLDYFYLQYPHTETYIYILVGKRKFGQINDLPRLNTARFYFSWKFRCAIYYFPSSRLHYLSVV